MTAFDDEGEGILNGRLSRMCIYLRSMSSMNVWAGSRVDKGKYERPRGVYVGKAYR
jgi:hypothetical protein